MNYSTEPYPFDRWLVDRMGWMGIGPTALGRQLGVTRAQVHLWRTGDCVPPMTRVPALALCLGVSADFVTARINDSRLTHRAPGRPRKVSA